MKWDDFLSEPIDVKWDMQLLTDVECPKCGRKIYIDTSIVLTSYPAKYKCWCSCGWTDYAPQKYVR